MREKLIEYLKVNGKSENISWYELAVKFRIGEGLTVKKRAKKAQDIWRGHKRSTRTIVEAEGPDTKGLIVKKLRVWDAPNGDKRQSVEFVAATAKAEEPIMKELWEDFKKEAAKYAPKYSSITYPKGTKGLMEICIPDLHLGKLAWDKETGEDYNLEEAKTRFFKALMYFIEASKNVEKFVLVVGNDFFNSDTMHGSTTPSTRNGFRGTPQQDDSRWQKTFLEGRKLLVRSIDELRKIAPVDVVIIPGNHDHQRCFYLGDTLESWYRNCKDVHINNDPRTRKYYQYGKNLIGYTHGDKEKQVDLPLIMANEMPLAWANSTSREWHIGHIHKTVTNELIGCTVRTVPSLSGTDAYHAEHGYTGSKKAAHAYLWDLEKGLIAMHQFNL